MRVRGGDEGMLMGAGTVLKQHVGGGKGASAQTDDLRRLRNRLEAAMRITETELQKTVFKCV